MQRNQYLQPKNWNNHYAHISWYWCWPAHVDDPGIDFDKHVNARTGKYVMGMGSFLDLWTIEMFSNKKR